MESTVSCLLVFLLVNHAVITAKPGKGTPLSDYILHYEPLHYDKDTFHTAHHRAKRSTKHDLHLDFHAHGKHFKLRLKRDYMIFSPDLVVENSDGEISFDTTRAYVGHLEGEEDSSKVMGVVTNDGLFEGKISTDEGEQYVIAQSKHHFTDPQQFHSVIYRHSDVHIPTLEDTKCKSDEIHRRIRTLQEEEGRKNRKSSDEIHHRIRTLQEAEERKNRKSSDEIHHMIRTLQEEEGQKNKKSHHVKPHHTTRLKSKEKGSSQKHKRHNIDSAPTRSISENLSTNDVSFYTSQLLNKVFKDRPENYKKKNGEQTHIPGMIDNSMDRNLHELSNRSVNVIDSTMGKSLSNVYKSDSVNDDHKRSKYPAKNHKSAQNHHHRHHRNHHNSNHHHGDDVATTTTRESKSEFQRLIDEYDDLQEKSAIDVNLDLEEIDSGTNKIPRGQYSDKDTSRPENVDTKSKPIISSPRETPSISTTAETNTFRKSGVSDLEHKDKDDRTRSQPHHRQKRTMIDPTRITCSLYLQADHLFYQKFHSIEETVIEQLTQHVQGVNEIYGAIDFDGDGVNDMINFVIKRIKVHTQARSQGYKFPGEYGVETYLELFSEDNFDAFCLAYMFTYRDFEGGTLGLAWTGDLQNAGGVCEKNGQFRGSLKSLNSGIVTILNYGKDVPSTVSHVTMAHEIGHNMGSQHDPETDKCSPGGELGNYIMFARATSGDKPNNNKFSECSQASMALVMEAKARHTAGCFIAPTSSICGNEVVEKGEECDCGWEDECKDQCCYPQTSSTPTHHKPCTRRPGARCSPSEGPCCTSHCYLIGPYNNRTCREATRCKDAAFCNGMTPTCPKSHSRPDKTMCDDGYVCHDGECTSSICVAYGLESCQCEPDERSNFDHPDLCKLCCKQRGDGQPCKSSHEWNAYPYDVPDWSAKPGSPCNDYKGYCDVFHKCREVDPFGPLANLKRFFSGEGMDSFKEWLTTYWYVVLAAGLLLLVLMALFVRLCAPRKTKVPVTPIKHHEQITPVAHAPPPPPLYSTQCVATSNKPLLDNHNHQHQNQQQQQQQHYKHSASSVAPTTPPILTRPCAPLLPPPPTQTPSTQNLTPIQRRRAPSPPCAKRKLLISGTSYPPGGKRLSQSEGWV